MGSYRRAKGPVQTLIAAMALLIAALTVFSMSAMSATAADRPVKIVVLGDSLTAGYGLGAHEAFPAKLEQALKGRGLSVEVANAGVSGDTASGGLSRLDWSVPQGTDAVIVELGANDALRGVDPQVTRAALDSIVRQLRARKIEVLLCGMHAPRNMGADYVARFDPIFREIADAHQIALYPFFLDGVAVDAKFTLQDGMHPNSAGVSKIVEGILPAVEDLIARVRARGGS